MTKILLTDIDDVCLSWISGFTLFIEKETDIKPKGIPNTWNMEKWLSIPLEEIKILIEEFNCNSWEFGCLPAINKANEILPLIHKSGVEIIGITCCSTNSKVTALRRVNLYHIFGNIFSHIDFLPLGYHKKEALAKYDPSNTIAWVEDRASAALEGMELGFNTFLMRKEHNRDHEAMYPKMFQYVNDWEEIYKSLPGY